MRVGVSVGGGTGVRVGISSITGSGVGSGGDVASDAGSSDIGASVGSGSGVGVSSTAGADVAVGGTAVGGGGSGVFSRWRFALLSRNGIHRRPVSGPGHRARTDLCWAERAARARRHATARYHRAAKIRVIVSAWAVAVTCSTLHILQSLRQLSSDHTMLGESGSVPPVGSMPILRPMPPPNGIVNALVVGQHIKHQPDNVGVVVGPRCHRYLLVQTANKMVLCNNVSRRAQRCVAFAATL